MLRKVTFGCACSLDNRIARQDHSVDWLHWDDEVAGIVADFWKTIDAVVMGRKTYEVALKNAPKSDANPYPGKKTYVFSRTLKPGAAGHVEIVSEDAAEFVRKLKAQEGKGICVMGGGELARSLFEADLIDEVGMNVHPVLLGAGIPLFLDVQRQIDLELLESRTLNNGCVLLTYRVKHP
jgi:dihydrofolate reductase